MTIKNPKGIVVPMARVAKGMSVAMMGMHEVDKALKSLPDDAPLKAELQAQSDQIYEAGKRMAELNVAVFKTVTGRDMGIDFGGL